MSYEFGIDSCIDEKEESQNWEDEFLKDDLVR